MTCGSAVALDMAFPTSIALSGLLANISSGLPFVALLLSSSSGTIAFIIIGTFSGIETHLMVLVPSSGSHPTPRTPTKHNLSRKAYCQEAEYEGDPHDEDQSGDPAYSEEDLDDSNLSAYLHDCYKAYKTSSTPKRPPFKNPKYKSL